jgi:hypothetical protein
VSHTLTHIAPDYHCTDIQRGGFTLGVPGQGAKEYTTLPLRLARVAIEIQLQWSGGLKGGGDKVSVLDPGV